MMIYRIFTDTGYANTASYNWQTVYDPTKSPYAPVNENAHDIHLDMEMSAAGALSFTLEKDHPLYNNFDSFSLLAYTVCVCISGDPSAAVNPMAADWFGRVVRVSTNFDKSRTVEVEGALAFLSDVHVRPHIYSHTEYSEGKTWKSGEPTEVTDDVPLITHIRQVMSLVNTYTSPKRQFALGSVDTSLYMARTPTLQTPKVNCPMTRGTENYIRYLEFLNECTDIDKAAALFWQPAAFPYTSSGTQYTVLGVSVNIIDLTKTSTAGSSSPIIDIDLNLVEHSEEISADDVFTRIIPFGTNKIRINDPYYTYTLDMSLGTYTKATPAGPAVTVDYEPTAEESRGIIETTMNFDADTPDVLNQMASQYAGAYVVQPTPILTLRAVDMALVNANSGYIGIGSIVRVSLTHTEEGQTKTYTPYICIKASISIDDPDASEFTLIPANGSGASYYKRQQALSRILAQHSQLKPSDTSDIKQNEFATMADISEIVKNGNSIDMIYGDRTERLTMYQDEASSEDPEQTPKYIFVGSTIVGVSE